MENKKELIYKEDVLAMAWLADECEVVTMYDIEELPPVDAYTGEEIDSLIQKAELLETENRNLAEEVDWLKNCLNCEIRNECPRHCCKVVHGCDHWVYGDNWVWCKDCRHYNNDTEWCGMWGEGRHPEHSCAEGERKDNG